MLTMFYGMLAGGLWQDSRQSNLLDGAAPFVKTYATSDGKFIALCTIEKRFYRALLDTLSVEDIDPADQFDRSKWPQHEAIFAELFATKTRDEWCDVFAETDACFAPILSMTEAPEHPHNVARKTFVNVDGIRQPAPAPRFSRTPSEIGPSPQVQVEIDAKSLADWGLSPEQVSAVLR